MGAENGEDPVGLVCDPRLVGTVSTSYSVDPVFEKFRAYPQQWIENADGEIVYGSLTEETKEALGYLRELYRQEYWIRILLYVHRIISVILW